MQSIPKANNVTFDPRSTGRNNTKQQYSLQNYFMKERCYWWSECLMTVVQLHYFSTVIYFTPVVLNNLRSHPNSLFIVSNVAPYF